MNLKNELVKEPLPANIPAPPNSTDPTGTTASAAEEAKQFAHRGQKEECSEKRPALAMVGGLVLVLIVSVWALVRAHQPKMAVAKSGQTKASANSGSENRGILPTGNTATSREADRNEGAVTPNTIRETATSHSSPQAAGTSATGKPPESLGSVAPFSGNQSWEPAPYQPGAPAAAPETATNIRAEREEMEKASLVFVRTTASGQSGAAAFAAEPQIGLGLPAGAKLRARLESAVNTAVQTPVVAVIEYNYERNGEIIVPAGSKAIGHLQQADRSGYLGIRFDSLVMPDGSTTAIEATATDLGMRALKGKVEGKNTGKNLLVRSFSGIGEAATMLVGRGSLNQPLSEGDMMRERVTSNIGQASDEELQRLSMGEHVVVVLPAGAEIYVILGRPAKQKPSQAAAAPGASHTAQPSDAPTAQQLRQLLELQRELNEQSAAKSSSD
jgi:hypothetical protein